MSKLSQTAQMVMDLFYQDYVSDENFLREEHFKYMVGCFYANLLVADYQESKAESIADTGYRYPTFSTELIRYKDFTTSTDGKFKYIETGEVMTFPYDNVGYGVSAVRCIKNMICGEFKRTTPGMKNKFGEIPYSKNIWWWVEGTRIYFYSSEIIPEKLSVGYIPIVDFNDDDFIIPQSVELKIVNGLVVMFKQAAAGVVIDTSNNSNPNSVIQSEIDTQLANLKSR